MATHAGVHGADALRPVPLIVNGLLLLTALGLAGWLVHGARTQAAARAAPADA